MLIRFCVYVSAATNQALKGQYVISDHTNEVQIIQYLRFELFATMIQVIGWFYHITNVKI